VNTLSWGLSLLTPAKLSIAYKLASHFAAKTEIYPWLKKMTTSSWNYCFIGRFFLVKKEEFCSIDEIDEQQFQSHQTFTFFEDKITNVIFLFSDN
jgi:hypothetical protein